MSKVTKKAQDGMNKMFASNRRRGKKGKGVTESEVVEAVVEFLASGGVINHLPDGPHQPRLGQDDIKMGFLKGSGPYEDPLKPARTASFG